MFWGIGPGWPRGLASRPADQPAQILQNLDFIGFFSTYKRFLCFFLVFFSFFSISLGFSRYWLEKLVIPYAFQGLEENWMYLILFSRFG